MLLFTLFILLVIGSLAISLLPTKWFNTMQPDDLLDLGIPPLDTSENWTSFEELQVFTLSDYQDNLNDLGVVEASDDSLLWDEPPVAEPIRLEFEERKEAA